MRILRRQYWWDGVPNFGDAMGPDIVEAFLGKSLPLAKAEDSDVLLGPGSIIDYCDEFNNPVVWGSGIDPHYGKVPDKLSEVTFLAVRGPLTRKLLGIDVPIMGDPALLLPQIYPVKLTSGPVTVVVHHSTFQRRKRDFFFDPYRSKYKIIEPGQPWQNVVDQICQSSFVFCQSLHGAIISEAYGVPWAWWKGFHGRLAQYKWNDFFGSISVKPESFRLSQLSAAMKWSARTRSKMPDLVALREVLTENYTVEKSTKE